MCDLITSTIDAQETGAEAKRVPGECAGMITAVETVRLEMDWSEGKIKTCREGERGHYAEAFKGRAVTSGEWTFCGCG